MLDTKVHKGDKFNKGSIFDMRTHFKPTETFQYTNFYSRYPSDVTKAFIEGKVLRLQTTNFYVSDFKTPLRNRDYLARIVVKHFSRIKVL